MKLGFVGLGKMGKPMALNLLNGTADLIVHSATTEAYEEFRSRGAGTADSLADVADADVVFLCLPDGSVVRDILVGKGALLERLHPGQMVVDTSTIDYATTVEMGKALSERGVALLDAPVSGMEARAIAGTLTVMCGGERAVFDKVAPLLELVGDNILYMGGPGSGQLTKLINQLLFDINCAALAEILPMAVKMGLDAEKVGSVVNSGTGRSYASEFFIPRILAGNFDEGYPMEHAYKDLVSAAELGARACIPMPVLAAATATYQTALLQGYGRMGKGAMVRPFEKMSGVEFRSSAA
jgi:3-hydroxyisobutyrate dehydrogenase-like beta-hydroxyacid dehydrogenase